MSDIRGNVFGRLAIEMRLVTQEQIDECLRIQHEMEKAGKKAPRLGELLAAKGYLTVEQVRDLLRRQKQASQRKSVRIIEPNLLRPGQYFGEYKILKYLNSDALWKTYKAIHREQQETVLLRILDRRRLEENPERVLDFERNARRLIDLDHPHIEHILATGLLEGQPYYAAEFIEGETLQQMLDARGRLDVAEAFQILYQAVQALEYGHAHNLYHQEIRPSHIMIDSDQNTYLLGFGLTRDVMGNIQRRMAQMESMPLYMAPEQMVLKGPYATYDARTDLYCLGATIYHALVGKAPFYCDTFEEILFVLAQAEVEDPAQVNPAVSRELADIILCMINAEPDSRYQTATQLRLALEALPPAAKTPVVSSSLPPHPAEGLVTPYMVFFPREEEKSIPEVPSTTPPPVGDQAISSPVSPPTPAKKVPVPKDFVLVAPKRPKTTKKPVEAERPKPHRIREIATVVGVAASVILFVILVVFLAIPRSSSKSQTVKAALPTPQPSPPPTTESKIDTTLKPPSSTQTAEPSTPNVTLPTPSPSVSMLPSPLPEKTGSQSEEKAIAVAQAVKKEAQTDIAAKREEEEREEPSPRIPMGPRGLFAELPESKERPSEPTPKKEESIETPKQTETAPLPSKPTSSPDLSGERKEERREDQETQPRISPTPPPSPLATEAGTKGEEKAPPSPPTEKGTEPSPPLPQTDLAKKEEKAEGEKESGKESPPLEKEGVATGYFPEYALTTRMFKTPRGYFEKDVVRFYESRLKASDPTSTGLPDPYRRIEYDISSRKACLYVPPSYTEKVPWGILIYLTDLEPTPVLYEKWKPVLEKNRLLFAAPHGASSSYDDLLRIALALDTLASIKNAYSIDENRVFIGGLRSGADVALLAALHFPKVFRGVYAAEGTVILGRTWTGVKKGDYYPVEAPYFLKADFDRIKRAKQRFAFLVTSRKNPKDRVLQSYRFWETLGWTLRAFFHPENPTDETILDTILQWLNGNEEAQADPPVAEWPPKEF